MAASAQSRQEESSRERDEKTTTTTKKTEHQHTFVVAFCGVSGSGKDTFADTMAAILDKEDPSRACRRVAFADPLKAIVSDFVELLCGAKLGDSLYDNQFKASASTPVTGQPHTWRTILQRGGTDILRRHLYDSVFADAVFAQIADSVKRGEHAVWLVSDLRFEEEARAYEMFAELHAERADVTCYLVELTREGAGLGAGAEGQHRSEKEISLAVEVAKRCESIQHVHMRNSVPLGKLDGALAPWVLTELAEPVPGKPADRSGAQPSGECYYPKAPEFVRTEKLPDDSQAANLGWSKWGLPPSSVWSGFV